MVTASVKSVRHKGNPLKENKSMKVTRKITVDTELFELGDIISFDLTTGEQVKAKAIRETPNGMLFMTIDCLKDEQKMFENVDEAEIVDYEHSDLRRKLNEEIFETFPEEIKERMVGMRIGNTNRFDMLRIPTEREIFDENPYGENEPKSVIRFFGMENRRERIAWQGCETGEFEWYWLQNKMEDSASYFANVRNHGRATYSHASLPHGVRPVFLLS